jgi:hypothetical protein
MTPAQLIVTLVAVSLPWLTALTLTYNRHGATIVGLFCVMASLAGIPLGIGLFALLRDENWFAPPLAFMLSSLVLAFGADALHHRRCTCDSSYPDVRAGDARSDPRV